MSFLAMLLQSPSDAMQQSMHHALAVLIPILFIVSVIAVAIILIPFWFICKKAGLSPWLTLLNLIPGGGLVLIYVLAFAEWKVVPAPQMFPYPLPYQPPYPPAPPTA